MSLGEGAKLILLSFDSTSRSNLSVGMPIDLVVYERDAFDVKKGNAHRRRRRVLPQSIRRLVGGVEAWFTTIKEFDV